MGQVRPFTIPPARAPRDRQSHDAEHAYNAALVKGQLDEAALQAVVDHHLATYPQGVDDHHVR